MGDKVVLLRKKATRQESLAKRILDSFDGSTFDRVQRLFLPENCLDDLVTASSIREELKLDELDLKILNKAWQQEFTTWIESKAKKVFAITVQCGLPHDDAMDAMQLFRRDGFTDALLPIGDPRSPTDVQTSKFDTDIWTNVRLYDFYEKQWKCLCPVFCPEQYSYNLSSECIFPFTFLAPVHTEGAFSSVCKVKIHDAHQRHKNIHEVAIKEILISKVENKGRTEYLWDKEARALEAINQLKHPHIVKCLAAIRRGDSRYFMFPWADGESLRDYWVKTPKQVPTEQVIEQTIRQLQGVADALDHLHNFHGGDIEGLSPEKDLRHPKGPQVNVQNEAGEGTGVVNKESIRHGDLKPENILRFNGTDSLGVLKIADMGLAKRHVVKTEYRPQGTSTRFGTIRYEAPETETAKQRSRLYDIWSMGCITLEFIIWILYGNDELNNFYDQLKGSTSQIPRYYEIPAPGERAELHSVVLQWMLHLEHSDPECQQESAIRDLLHIVRTQLLIVPLPPNRPTSEDGSIHPGPAFVPPGIGEEVTRYRATAQEFREALDRILEKVHRKDYLLTGRPRVGITTPQPKPKSSGFLSADGPGGQKTRARGGAAASRDIKTAKGDYQLPPLRDWEFPVDDEFAEKVRSHIGSEALRPRSSKPASLCDACSKLNFWTPGFAFEYAISHLAARSPTCSFCALLLPLATQHTPIHTSTSKARFERHQSTLLMTGALLHPVLSILRSPALHPPLPIQLGFPSLPPPGSKTSTQLIQLWLQDCDANHPECSVAPTRPPTRLIDVGTVAAPVLRIVETGTGGGEEVGGKRERYIALSHPWGDPAQHPPFCTLRSDPSGRGRSLENFKREIPHADLPATFRDAVSTTRALGVRFLWIDSLCILQGADGDFNTESKRMADVFSGAYCVLAASRASGQGDGFLGARERERAYVEFQRAGEEPFYVCEAIDNFSAHVLDGGLNARGWVLQERALARRTVFFAEAQMYFECGRGVRCETLGTMHNNMADFLGDPSFPSKAMRSTRGLRIRYFQDLYQLYSRLSFSHIEDRPYAIAGLEKRLISAYDTRGGFGIFDGTLFHRSLLWQRGADEASLTPIVFPVERNVRVPSWSWMAYKGGIDYVEPPFDSVEWEGREIQTPWTAGGGGQETASAAQGQDGYVQLVARVRDFTVAGRRADEVRLVYDDTERSASDGQRPQCVVVARSKEGRTEREKRCYVLIVMPTGAVGARGERMYRRVGAGFMLGKYITDLGGEGIDARIQ